MRMLVGAKLLHLGAGREIESSPGPILDRDQRQRMPEAENFIWTSLDKITFWFKLMYIMFFAVNAMRL